MLGELKLKKETKEKEEEDKKRLYEKQLTKAREQARANFEKVTEKL